MTVPPRAALAWFFGLALAATAPQARAAQPASTQNTETVLLLTSPRSGELENLLALVERGWLVADSLRVIGLHHADEWTSYQTARAWLDSTNAPWMELKAVDCDLAEDQVFGANGCSAEFERLFERSDGLVFSGGPDIPPGLYGQPTRLTTVIVDPPRHRFEISLLVHLLRGDPKAGRAPLLERRPDYLVLGLCLGMQTLNVATGGDLVQDIPSQTYGLTSLEQYEKLPAHQRHRSAAAQRHPAAEIGWGHLHPVRFANHPLARRLVPDRKPVTVFSLHHQAAGRIGRDLSVWASSLDGKVIEGLAHKRYPAVFGVQFHPEKRILFDPELVYRQAEGAEPANFAAAGIAADSRARPFHQRFWELVSELLRTSRRARTAATAR